MPTKATHTAARPTTAPIRTVAATLHPPSAAPTQRTKTNETTKAAPVAATPISLVAAAKAPAPTTSVAPRAADTKATAVPVSLTQATNAGVAVKPAVSVAAMTSAADPKAAAATASLTQPENGSPVVAAPPPSANIRPAIVSPAIVAKAPTNPQTAAAFVSDFLKEAFRLAKANGTSLQRRAQLAELFASKMDVKRIAGYTTANELTTLSPDLQQRFRTILVSYLVETYYPRLELASDPSIKVETAAAEPLADGTAVVWTTFTKDGWGSQSVQWHLAPGDGGLKIVDIFSAGASVVQMERDTFLSVMRNGGLSQLMAKLDARTKELASAATE